MYYSTGEDLGIGSHAIIWDGRDQDGNPVHPGEYTYYLWGYDNVNRKQVVVQSNEWIVHRWSSVKYADHMIVERDFEGNIHPKPIIYFDCGLGRYGGDVDNDIPADLFGYDSETGINTRSRWFIGNDHLDTSLMEYTYYVAIGAEHNISPDPYEAEHFITRATDGDLVAHIRRFEWITGGESIQDMDWGDGGAFTFNVAADGGWDATISGMEYVGDDLLAATNSSHYGFSNKSELILINASDGSEMKRLDVSEWWVDPDDADAGGQASGGPNQMSVRDGRLALASHGSCMYQVINPLAGELKEDFMIWSNGNGDIIGDRNYSNEVLQSPEMAWVCIDYTAIPNTYMIKQDANYFTAIPINGLGSPAFALMAPDGSGIGHFTYTGEGPGPHHQNDFVDTGGAYDGNYMDNVGIIMRAGAIDETTSGIWYVAHDSMKGIITASTKYLALHSPNGGEEFEAETILRISWSATVSEPLALEYTVDNGSLWYPIAADIDAAAGSYDWQLPAGLEAPRVLIRISDAGQTGLTDTSDGPFAIKKPYISLTYPVGGETLETGFSTTIFWTHLGVESVSLDYSPDNGTTWSAIAVGVDANDGRYIWTPPDLPSSDYYIRITDDSNPALSDMNDTPVTVIQSFIRLTVPNGGEQWEMKTVQTIAWEKSDGVKNVTIEFSPDSGDTWHKIRSMYNNVGEYSFDAPNVESSQCLIRLYALDNTAIKDESDDFYSIVQNPDWLPGWHIYNIYDGLYGNDVSTVFGGTDKEAWAYSWIGDYGGISYFDGDTWTIWPNKDSSLGKGTIAAFATDSSCDIWCCTSDGRLFRYDNSVWQLEHSLPVSIFEMIIDADDTMWLAVYDDGLMWFDGAWHTEKPHVGGVYLSIRCCHVDRNGDVLVGFINQRGIARFDGNEWTYYVDEEIFPERDVMQIDSDEGGTVYCATYDGLVVLNDDGGKLFTEQDGMPRTLLHDVLVGSDGRLWVGTNDGAGMYDGEKWTVFKTNTILGRSNVRRITENGDGIIWFATDRDGIVSFDPSTLPEPLAVDNDEDNNALLPEQLTVKTFPNPFNPATTIEFALPEESHVTADIYNLAGQKVETIVDSRFPTGRHTVVWDASNHANGMYFCRIASRDHVRTVKMMLVK
ncbi:hypothetical protein ES708_14280 [subsurface metagenome]